MLFFFSFLNRSRCKNFLLYNRLRFLLLFYRFQLYRIWNWLRWLQLCFWISLCPCHYLGYHFWINFWNINSLTVLLLHFNKLFQNWCDIRLRWNLLAFFIVILGFPLFYNRLRNLIFRANWRESLSFLLNSLFWFR